MTPTTTDAPLLDFAGVLLANKQLAVEKIPLDGQAVTGPVKISGMAFQLPSPQAWHTTVGNVRLPP